MNNYTPGETEQETKDSSSLIKSKFDYELFDEEKAAVVNKCVHVKRIDLPNKGEKWKIFDNSKQIFVLEGNKLTKKEKDFLKTFQGISLLIRCGKEGIKNVTSLRKKIKEGIESLSVDK